MKKEYDFSGGERGKFYRPTKIQKTIRFDADIIEFFQKEASKKHMGYQTLINNKLREIMEQPTGTVIIKHLKKEIRETVKSAIKKELKAS